MRDFDWHIIEELENEHTIVNGFLHKVKKACSTTETPMDKLQLLVSDLVAYCKDHFLCEEEFMQLIDFPDLEEHRQWHERCLHEFENCFDLLSSDCDGVANRLVEFLQSWLDEHLSGPDRELGEYISRHYRRPVKYGN